MTQRLLLFYVLLAVLVAVATALFCAVARRMNQVDRPDAYRKTQRSPIPVGAGVIVYLAYLLALFCVSRILPQSAALHSLQTHGIIGAWLVVVGARDDRRPLFGPIKLALQLAPVALWLILAPPVHNITLFRHVIPLGVFYYPLAVLWLFGAINSYNLLDGADGFLSTLVVITALALAFIAVWTHDRAGTLASLALASSTLGFLALNFPPARAYLGDAGSLTLGFLQASLTLHVLTVDNVVHVAPALCLMTTPIFDSLCAIVRRRCVGRSVFSPDLAHFHHHLQRRLGSSERPLLALIIMQTALALAAYWSVRWHMDVLALGTSLVVCVALVTFDLFGRDEAFMIVALLRYRLSRLIRGRQATSALFLAPRASQNWHKFWQNAQIQARQAQCSGLAMHLYIPLANVDWFGSWGVTRRHISPWRARRTRVCHDAQGVEIEIPLRLDKRYIGALYAHIPHNADLHNATLALAAILESCRQLFQNENEKFETSPELPWTEELITDFFLKEKYLSGSATSPRS